MPVVVIVAMPVVVAVPRMGTMLVVAAVLVLVTATASHRRHLDM